MNSKRGRASLTARSERARDRRVTGCRESRTAPQPLSSNLGARIRHVTTGGFDSHAARDNTHARLLAGFSDPRLAFQDASQDSLDAHGLGDANAVLGGRHPQLALFA